MTVATTSSGPPSLPDTTICETTISYVAVHSPGSTVRPPMPIVLLKLKDVEVGVPVTVKARLIPLFACFEYGPYPPP